MPAPLALFLLLSTQKGASTFPLTVESIMRGYDLIGHAPNSPQFSLDGKTLFFRWGKAGQETRLYAVDSTGDYLRPAKEADRIQALAIDGDFNTDKTKFTYALNGDIYWTDRDSGASHQLTNTADDESDPHFILGGQSIAFRRGDNVYAIDRASGSLTQLTDIRPTPEATAPGGQVSTAQVALAAEQAKLFKLFAPGKPGERDDSPKVARAKPFFLPAATSVGGLSVSPAGDTVAITLYKVTPGRRVANVPNYVTRSGFVEDIPTREKVGDPQDEATVTFLDTLTGDATPMTTPRPADAYGVQWSPDGKFAALTAHARDNKDQWILLFDPTKKSLKPIFTEHDDAWVGPLAGNVGWLKDSQRIYFTTENDGFANLYTLNVTGGEAKAVVKGNFEVTDARLSNDGKSFTFRSSEKNPFLRHLDRVSVDGGERVLLTESSDQDPYLFSPDEDRLCVIRSVSNRPPELLVGAPTALEEVTETPTKEWLSYPWFDPPIVTFKARDGADVPARLYKPATLKPGAPAVLFVHGAGYLQNVASWWSYYFREYMFNQILLARGYVVLDMDYRASAGYGKKWRTGVYRHMGGNDLNDLVDGAKFLVDKFKVDPKRIGLYGGSYGGFLTLMAMFAQPKVFAAGAALRPVTDWAHYNHGYTSEILNQPQDDPEAYRQSSPIYFAEGLEGSLLICHGMIDTNVHFQDSVRLAQRLIELGKQNWELAPFPSEDHAFVHNDSWTDEYRRILKLFESTIGKK